MWKNSVAVDPRWFQVIFQSIFLFYGILFLHWHSDYLHYAISIGGCLLFQYLFDSCYKRRWLRLNEFSHWGFSILISAMSLCLLLKTNQWHTSLLAAFITVAGKYFFRIDGKHIFNPSALGIVTVLIFTGDAWLSPGQWGSSAVIFFLVITLGTIVITGVQRLDISFAFLITYVGLLFFRQIIYLQWPMDFFIHSVSTGSLLLFTFFMISDPKTAPQHPLARIIWAMIIAIVSFYLAAFKWKYNTMIWVMVCAAPLVPLLNRIFKAKPYEWKNIRFSNQTISNIKRLLMKPFLKKTAAMFLLLVMMIPDVSAFCGFYVAKADGTLKNKTSQVILVRDGNRNVITMYNDFKGNLKDFAMVVPVPVVLKKSDIKVVNQSIFTILNDYSKPRLVEYFDANPCTQSYKLEDQSSPSTALQGRVLGVTAEAKRKSVTIEAQYIVGEYDILILSATESAGLKDWLTTNGYKIPAGAEEVLEPYIKSNLKFFVVKVNEAEMKKRTGEFLRPLQISFNSPKFMLPIRLGMANADGDQDMIVYAFTKTGRVECTNYRTVELPTGRNIPLFVKDNFGAFYNNLFQYQWKKEGRSISMLEYAWDVSPKNYVKCDPCVSNPPTEQDLLQAGVWWIKRNWKDYDDIYEEEAGKDSDVHFTRLHIRYNRKDFPQDLSFQVTPNKENYQARYIVTHPAEGEFDCESGKNYLSKLKERRKKELEQLTILTGKTYDTWDLAVENNQDSIHRDLAYSTIASSTGDDGAGSDSPLFHSLALLMVALTGIGVLLLTRRKHPVL